MTIANKKSYEAPAVRLIALRYQSLIMGVSGKKSLSVKTDYGDDVEEEESGSESEGKRTLYNLGW